MLKFFASFGIAIGILFLDVLSCLFFTYMWAGKDGDVLDDGFIVMAVVNTLGFSIVLAIIIVEKFL